MSPEEFEYRARNFYRKHGIAELPGVPREEILLAVLDPTLSIHQEPIRAALECAVACALIPEQQRVLVSDFMALIDTLEDYDDYQKHCFVRTLGVLRCKIEVVFRPPAP